MLFIIIKCSQLLHIILKFTLPISEYVLNILYRLIMGQTKPLPPIKNQILLLSATELADKIRKRQLSCKSVMQAYIQRARKVHPLINAVVDERYDDALQEAKDVDHFLTSNAKTQEQMAEDTPLLGVPFTCKEVLGIKGLSQTNGIVKERNHTADEDCYAAALFRKAGAIPIAVTNVPETCRWWETANLIHGMTKNPYDNTRTVGGSSGGEASIITSAGSIIGIGNDSGGSIRIPSSFCGIYGHKPSIGIVSNWGCFPHCDMMPCDCLKNEKWCENPTPFLSTGPLCRYASDLPILLKVLSDNDTKLQLQEKVNFHNVKVYYIKEIPGFLMGASLDIKKAITKATRHFEDHYGTRPIPLFSDEMRYANEIIGSKLTEVGCASMRTYLKSQNGSLNLWQELLKCIFRCSNHTFPVIFSALETGSQKDEHYYSCLEKFNALQRKFDEIFKEDAIVLFPTYPETVPHYLMTIPKFPYFAYTEIFNMLGFPVTAIPAGFSNGLPIGIQAISGLFKDHLTIATAMELDKVFNGWTSPCPINV